MKIAKSTQMMSAKTVTSAIQPRSLPERDQTAPSTLPQPSGSPRSSARDTS